MRIYILSTGRCATNFFHRFFSDNYPELKIQHQKRWSRVINIVSNLPINESVRLWFIDFIFKYLRKEPVPLSTVDPMLSTALLLKFKTNIPENVRLIHLTREPGSYAESFLSWSRKGIKKFILNRVVPYWMPKPGRIERKILAWSSLSKRDKYYWVWYKKNVDFLKIENDESYLRVKLEDLVDMDVHEYEWNRLFTFMGLKNTIADMRPILQKRINQSASKGKTGSAISNEELFKLIEEIKIKLGYS